LHDTVLEVLENMITATLARRFAVAALPLVLAAGVSRAAIVITEVDPSGSSSTSNTYNADWFELTNTGAAVDISGWRMDDNSHTFASAVGLRGVTSIAPGQSVVFVEGAADGSTDSTIDANFESFWFGSNVPAGFTIGNYGGTGVGLSTSADEVNIYDAAGNEVVGVGFGATTTGVSLDNSAGVGNAAQPDLLISTNSIVGVNGAFASANAAAGVPNEIGSPGVAGATPEPASLGVLAVGGTALLARRRK
jgi:hypothetical protein